MYGKIMKQNLSNTYVGRMDYHQMAHYVIYKMPQSLETKLSSTQSLISTTEGSVKEDTER